jgi:hypothetical protein
MAEENLIICMSFDGSQHYITPGYKVYNCSDCGCEVTAAPSSQTMINRGDFKVICLVCTSKRGIQWSPQIMNLAPGAIQEVMTYLHRQ